MIHDGWLIFRVIIVSNPYSQVTAPILIDMVPLSPAGPADRQLEAKALHNLVQRGPRLHDLCEDIMI